MDYATAYQAAGGNRVRNNIDVGSFTFDGGLDIMDAPADVQPGQLLGCLNYEPGVRGGYRRFDGYERFDGHPSPTDTGFVSIGIPDGFEPPVGQTITEGETDATGSVAYVDTINNVIVITNITGEFLGQGRTLTCTYGSAESTTPAYVNGGTSDELSNEYYLQKYLYLQSFIGPVGGSDASGPVLGAFPYKGDVVAFRNNAAGTAADMWIATPTGWSKIDLGIKVRFDAGIYSSSMEAPPEGTVLTGATSGATMTVKRINAMSGTWGTDAAGYFITDAITGTLVPGEDLQVGGVTYMTYVSKAAQVLQPNGTYYFIAHNFLAAENADSGFRLYGVNGVDYGFEYDSLTDTFVQIETGMDDDKPTHLEAHAEYLFYAFRGGSLQNSGYQRPLNWNLVFGADERSVGEDVTFLRENVDSTLVIGTRRRVWTLTGIAVESFAVKIYAPSTGAIAKSDENPGQVIFMEDRGFTRLSQTPAYGNFQASSLSDKILDIVTKLMATDTPVGAVITRKRNLVRIMFASGTVLCLGVNASGQFGGWTQGLYPDTPHAFFGGFYEDGIRQIERAFLCAENGYLYEMDKGRSFDGKNVSHFIRMSYYNANSNDYYKRWRRIAVDVQPEGYATLSMSVDFDYGNRSGQVNRQIDVIGNGGYWDVSAWDFFVWSSARYTQAIIKLESEGFNIGLFFSGNSNNDAPLTLYGASLQYSSRIINRNTKDA